MLKDTLTDNEALFLEALIGAIRHADSMAEIAHTRNLNSVAFTITPSKDEFKQDIINNLLHIHHTYHMKVKFSKSLSLSKKITFSLNLENFT